MPHDPHRAIVAAQMLRREIEALTADEDVVRDTLEGEVDLDGILDHLIKGLSHDETLILAIGSEIAKLEDRIARLTARTEVQKTLIRKAMEVAGWSKRERPLATLSLGRKAPCLGALDEAKIPAKFWVEVDPRLSKKALLEALKAGEEVPGASLAPDDYVLSIRRG